MESTSQAPASQDSDTLWTARVQFLNSTTKPVKLLELGDGPRGKFARIEFADEVTRPVYLQTMADAWHPLFDSLTSEEQWKIRRFFSPFDPEQLPDGNLKTRFNLSFVTRTTNKRGKYISENNFDVPAQSYGDGRLTGLKLAQEYMAALSLPNFRCTSLMSIVCDMAACLVEGADNRADVPDRRNVAIGFILELEGMLSFSAQHCRHQAYFEEKIASTIAHSAKHEQLLEGERRERKTKSLESMRATKAAKRQAAEKGALAA